MTRTDYAPRPGMSEAEIDETVAAILRETTLEEKVAMMSGRGFLRQFIASGGRWGGDPYRAGGGCDRLGVPALYFTDGPRGVARGQSTCFPVSMARGASFDRDLERRIGEVIGIEARAQDCTLSGAVCVNLLRHPAWGRAQETYGEDPYHVGEMGAALCEGIQTHNVVATVKHFAVNSIENARFKVDVRVDERTLREVYLPHFERVLDAGCASVMSAYNKLNGEYCGQNRDLLTTILRTEWGFDGFVHSDWLMGVYAPYGASAGLDVENPEPVRWGQRLIDAVEAGHVEPQVIDQACRRILTVTYRFASAEDPLGAYTADLVASPAHVALAQEAAEKSCVLLRNDGTLPLSAGTRVAVFGRLAGAQNLGDDGSSRVRPPRVVTLADALSSGTVAGDEADPAAAAAAARDAEVCVIVVGYDKDDEGEFIPADMGIGQAGLPPEFMAEIAEAMTTAVPAEQAAPLGDRGGDRASLRLPDEQVALIRAVTDANPRTIVLLVAGSAVLTGEWDEAPAALCQVFYPGMAGGEAVRRLLFGEASPSGRLPFTVAQAEDDYPFFDRDADAITYGYWHGYAKLDRDGRTPRYPFGHGLSYAHFAYRALSARRVGDGVAVQVSVRNESDRPAAEVVQIYLGPPGRTAERPAKLLRGFERVTVQPGETRTVRFSIPARGLAYWDASSRAWRIEAGTHRIFAGPSSDAARLLATDVVL